MEAIKKKINPQFLKKYSWVAALIILVVAILVIQSIPTVQAGTPTNGQKFLKNWETFYQGFGVTSFSMMRQAYDQFQLFLTTNGELTGTTGIATLSGVITGLAHFLVVLYMLIGMIKEGTRGEIDTDMIYWFRIFAGTAVAFVMVSCISTIIGGIYELGSFIIDKTADSAQTEFAETDVVKSISFDEDHKDNQKKLISALETLPGFEGLGTLIKNGGKTSTDSGFYDLQSCNDLMKIMSIAVYAPVLIAAFLMYSAVFEIKIRQIFAPIAVASISYEGARGSGVRFLKKLMACFIKIAIYFFIAYIGYQLMLHFTVQFINDATPTSIGSTDFTSATIYLALALLANVVSALSMLQMGGLADEIVGA